MWNLVTWISRILPSENFFNQNSANLIKNRSHKFLTLTKSISKIIFLTFPSLHSKFTMSYLEYFQLFTRKVLLNITTMYPHWSKKFYSKNLNCLNFFNLFEFASKLFSTMFSFIEFASHFFIEFIILFCLRIIMGNFFQ